MITSFIEKSKIPHNPGVYIFRNSTGKVLYVGKAIDLYSRVGSYFQKTHFGLTPKTQVLVKEIASVATIVVESELEALILEANLIKKYLPSFNVKLTDDKDYLYITITNEDFPKVVAARKKDLKGAKKYWGPFPSSRTVRETLRSLRRIFPWCSNPPGESETSNRRRFLDNGVTLEPTSSRGHEVIAKTRQRPCFYYHLNLCPGACTGLVDKSEYQKIIHRFSRFMDGKKDELISKLMQEMTQAAQKKEFEEANRVKKVIEGISYLTQTNRIKLYLENPNFLEEEKRLALITLQKDLNLASLPERVEGYDISNIQGKQATGSMVVLTGGEIDKKEYRKFKIRISGKPNDVGMIREMMSRRLNHPEWPMPDLIIIDGGKGQVRGVNSLLLTTGYKLPIFGLAKRLEWLYPPQGEVIKLSRRSLSLKLLQKLRDEAHRFAISYHRKLRDTIYQSR